MALALSRKPGEGIRIGPNIYVQVVDIRGETVRLAITAPREVTILREEVPDRNIGGRTR